MLTPGMLGHVAAVFIVYAHLHLLYRRNPQQKNRCNFGWEIDATMAIWRVRLYVPSLRFASVELFAEGKNPPMFGSKKLFMFSGERTKSLLCIFESHEGEKRFFGDHLPLCHFPTPTKDGSLVKT